LNSYLRGWAQFLLLTVGLSALFGALHDQISYQLAPEYYQCFKFAQFGLAQYAWPEPIKAGLVGGMASGWMGLFPGLLWPLLFRRCPLPAATLWPLLRRPVLPLLLCCALASGIGLMLGVKVGQDAVYLAAHPLKACLTDVTAFWQVAYMHRAAYVGGSLAIVVGSGWLWWQRRRLMPH